MRGFRRLAELRSPSAFVDTFGFEQTFCPRSDRTSRLATAFQPRSGLTTLIVLTTKARFEDPWRRRAPGCPMTGRQLPDRNVLCSRLQTSCPNSQTGRW